MKILEISNDSVFLGLANFGRYKSFISGDWDFKMMKKRIIEGNERLPFGILHR